VSSGARFFVQDWPKLCVQFVHRELLQQTVAGCHKDSVMIRRYGKLLIVVLVVFSLLFWLTLQFFYSFQARQMVNLFQMKTAIAARFVQDDFASAKADLLILANSPAFRDYIRTGDREKILQLYSSLLQHKKRYAQIHYVDKSGKELLRVDYLNKQPVIHELQTVIYTHHPYASTLGLGTQQVDISPLELQLSKDSAPRVEPVLFLSTPVRDEHGLSQGVLAINLVGSRTVRDFYDVMRGCQHCYLVTQNGFYIQQRPVMQKRSFANQFPDSWKVIKSKLKGTIKAGDGTFVFHTAEMNGENNWKVVALVPKPQWLALLNLHYPFWPLWYLVGLVLAMIISVTIYRIAHRRTLLRDALSQSEQQVRELYDQAPCGYHSLNEDGLIIKMNATELKWLGYEHDEIVNKVAFTSLLNPVSRVYFKHTFAEFKLSGTIKDVEYTMVRKDGSEFTVLVSAVAEFDEQQRFLLSRATVFDISQRKSIEQALAQSEQVLRNAMDHAPIGMAIASLQGQFEKINQVFLQLTGFAVNEITQKTFLEVTVADDLKRELPRIKDLLEGRIDHYQIDKRILTKSEDEIWINQHVSILHDLETNAAINLIVQAQEITDRKLAESSLVTKAYYDTLTELPNRRLLHDRLTLLIQQAVRYKRQLALLFVDIDFFKHVNDQHGHAVGDELLKVIAAQFQSVLRASDVIARIAGDEFVIVLTEVSDKQGVKHAAEKILASMREINMIQGHEIKVSCSIGIALYPGDAETIDALLQHADAAMYEAKEKGRSQIQFYDAMESF